jgi:aminopeptidase N
MQWFKDEEDQLEYVYTNSEPDHSHLWFPCFDQPDLKAPYSLLVLAPTSWVVVSTTGGIILDKASAKVAYSNFGVTNQMKNSFGTNEYLVHEFDKSAPISTYLYCICAGPYE